MPTVAEKLLTAEEFAAMPDPGHPTELRRGRVVDMPPPGSRHGQICSKVGRLLGNHAEAADIGHVVTNDSGVITERGPDSVRGADVAFYRYERLPRGPLPDGYPDVPPDLVFEVVSPSDRWSAVLAKVSEYLDAGVGLVCVLRPGPETLRLVRPDGDDRTLGPDDEFTAPDILGDFRVPVRRFFE